MGGTKYHTLTRKRDIRLKKAFVAINVLLTAIVVVTITVGIWLSITLSRFHGVIGYRIDVNGSILTIASGLFILFFLCLGFHGALKENRGTLIANTIVVLSILSIELIVLLLAVAYNSKVPGIVKNQFNQRMSKYGKLANATKFIDTVQTEYSCCGAFNKTCWLRHGARPRNTQQLNEDVHTDQLETQTQENDERLPIDMQLMPQSCCREEEKEHICRYHDVDDNTPGCVPILASKLNHEMLLFINLTIVFIVLLIIALILSYMLLKRVAAAEKKRGPHKNNSVKLMGEPHN